MKKYFNRIKVYYEGHGLVDTISWLYNCLKFKIRIRNSYKFDYSFKETEKNGFINKDTKNVFIFATVNYYDIGGGQRSSQLAKTFDKMGYRVFYIYGFKSYESTIVKIANPCLMHLHVDSFNLKDFNDLINKDDLVIFEAPFVKFEDYFDIAKENQAKIVYENIDNWEDAELGRDILNFDSLEKFIKDADLITCTAKPLEEQMRSYLKKHNIKRDILYLPNAVDDELFNPKKAYYKPYDLITGSKTLLYYGSLWGSWFDWDLLFNLAIMNPRISINLIGDYHTILDIVHNAPKNIHFLGLKPQDSLPSYLYYSDFAILPFKNDNIGKYVSPLKIFEYISMGKKVIATSLPDILGYPNVVYADSLNDWNNALESDFLDEDVAYKFALNNNWYSRISELLLNLYKDLNKDITHYFNEKLSVVVLNYNNMNVIFRCIDTLIEYRERYNYEIVVVDNGSKDGSYEKLLEKYSKKSYVKVLRNTKNGCSSGRNLGVLNASGQYIMFLDSDEWITNKYWLDNYLSIMYKLGDKTVVGWGAGWFNKKGYAYHVVDSFPFRYLPPEFIATNDIGYLATCGFIINKDFFNEIGTFDVFYDPTCYEDTDLSLAVRHNGGEIYYSRYLGVGHLPHQTTKSGTKAHEELIFKKGNYFVNKWKKLNRGLIFKHIKKL